MDLFSLLFMGIIIFILYMMWDFFFNGGWMRWIPGYSIVDSIFGGLTGSGGNNSSGWFW